MERKHLTRDEMMRAIGLFKARMCQVDVARKVGTAQRVISRLHRRYREVGDVAEIHRGRIRITDKTVFCS